ncbi:FliI/YscN family ATPase [Flavimaricola marinus]|uniref:Flagellum-specific ATP synthase n=1 Tax=Flavimaricola marinus TaxID=1819565 RepID=A0A238LF51_9RHOB|nr:FliI/YscN family ATPase [Flavimaricola marinus]SMY08238.1 Flagellum-specific ATP synthase [Flavimaricola marinus]
MQPTVFEKMSIALDAMRATHRVGRVTEATGGMVHVSGLSEFARLGDRVRIGAQSAPVKAEVIRIDRGSVQLMLQGAEDGLLVGDPVILEPRPRFAPDESWIGRVVDPDGLPLDGRPLLAGAKARNLRADPPPPQARRQLGTRLETGLAIFDTMLPIVRGQRIGLFSGSGVGKSTLLGDLARGVNADVIVIGLVGERGRELRHFVEDVLGAEGMARAVVVAATSDRAPQLRRRCAWAATAVAEHFRDEGKQVLLLLDSVTRFAEAHRELASTAGEASGLRGYPATTGPAIAALSERAGPGVPGTGDITAIYTVLVAGSDMEEPVADMLRGVLDGHVVLDREIAERGRFPAVNMLRSVSRSLPKAATDQENVLIAEARAMMGAYDRAEMMIQAGLYTPGSDAAIDAAIACHIPLETFMAQRVQGGIASSFAALRKALSYARPQPRSTAKR